MADVHLRPTIITLTKILSDTIHYVVGKENIAVKTTKEGEIQFWHKGCQLLPPSGYPNAWSVWGGKNWYHFWWLVDYAYQVAAEYKWRFQLPEDTMGEDYSHINKWIVSGIQNIIHRPAKMELAEFPLVLPYKELVKLGDTTKISVVDVYRAYYAAQKGKVRMRWTRRTMPKFIPETIN